MHRSPKCNKSFYGELRLKYKSLYGDYDMTLKSINVWVLNSLNKAS